jgi:hypothetical protein
MKENILLVNARSWQKDSFGLFDYESKDLVKQTIKFDRVGKLMRHEEPTSDKDPKRLLVDLVPLNEDLESPDFEAMP